MWPGPRACSCLRSHSAAPGAAGRTQCRLPQHLGSARQGRARPLEIQQTCLRRNRAQALRAVSHGPGLGWPGAASTHCPTSSRTRGKQATIHSAAGKGRLLQGHSAFSQPQRRFLWGKKMKAKWKERHGKMSSCRKNQSVKPDRLGAEF